jgi:hypothetical protein
MPAAVALQLEREPVQLAVLTEACEVCAVQLSVHATTLSDSSIYSTTSTSSSTTAAVHAQLRNL